MSNRRQLNTYILFFLCANKRMDKRTILSSRRYGCAKCVLESKLKAKQTKRRNWLNRSAANSNLMLNKWRAPVSRNTHIATKCRMCNKIKISIRNEHYIYNVFWFFSIFVEITIFVTLFFFAMRHTHTQCGYVRTSCAPKTIGVGRFLCDMREALMTVIHF